MVIPRRPHILFRHVGGPIVAALPLLVSACGDSLGPEDLFAIRISSTASQEGLAGIAVPDPPAVLALDEKDRPIPGVTVTFEVGEGGGTVSPSSVTTGEDGIGRVSAWTLGPVVGENTLVASAGDLSTRLTFAAVGETGPVAQVIKIAGDDQITTAGLAVLEKPSVTVADQFGNPVGGVVVTFTVAEGGGVVAGGEVTTLPSGVARAFSWTLGPDPGVNRLEATVPGVPPAVFTAIGEPGPTTIAIVEGNNQDAAAGEPVPTSPVVRVTDARDLPVADVPVAFVVVGGGGTVQDDTVRTDMDGLATTEWTLGTTTGRNTLAAQLADLGVVLIRATGVPGPPTGLEVAFGDDQIGGVGAPLPGRPVARVVDQYGNPVPGVAVEFVVTDGGGTIEGGSVVSDEDGLASPAAWILGPAPGTNTAEARASGLAALEFTAEALAEVYDLDVVRLGGGGPEFTAALQEAADRWRSVLIGDLPDVSFELDTLEANACGGQHPEVTDVVDDVRIFALVTQIDGPFGTLARAGPCVLRDEGLLTVIGRMEFDSEDLQRLVDNGRLVDVVLHEMGHVLGIGTLWDNLDLLRNPSDDNPNTDTHFVGPRAIAAFDQIGGADYLQAKVPVENIGGGGTRNSHWRESIFDRELMTGFIDEGSNPMSLVTTESLGDLGYEINSASADKFAIPGALATFNGLAGDAGRSRIALGDDVLRGPLFTITRDGRIRVVIR